MKVAIRNKSKITIFWKLVLKISIKFWWIVKINVPDQCAKSEVKQNYSLK